MNTQNSWFYPLIKHFSLVFFLVQSVVVNDVTLSNINLYQTHTCSSHPIHISKVRKMRWKMAKKRKGWVVRYWYKYMLMCVMENLLAKEFLTMLKTCYRLMLMIITKLRILR